MKKLLPFLLLILTVSVLFQAFGATASATAPADAPVAPWLDKFNAVVLLVMMLGRIAAGWKANGFTGSVNSLVLGSSTESSKK